VNARRRRQKKAERKALVVPVDLPRDEAMRRAQAIADAAAKKLPRGTRIVVAVTDVTGEWVGVGSNTNPKDIEAILRSALLGADRQDGKIIDVTGDEV
jgi:predicted sugar kinase